jgi:multidrug efflux pump
VGGLMLSQMLTLYTTPVVFLYMDRFGAWARQRWNGWYHGLMKDRPEDHTGGPSPAPAE